MHFEEVFPQLISMGESQKWIELIETLDSEDLTDFLFEVASFSKPERNPRLKAEDFQAITEAILTLGERVDIKGKACLCTAFKFQRMGSLQQMRIEVIEDISKVAFDVVSKGGGTLEEIGVHVSSSLVFANRGRQIAPNLDQLIKLVLSRRCQFDSNEYDYQKGLREALISCGYSDNESR